MSDVQQILIDMIHLSPVQVYKKYGIGIRTQIKIKESVVADFMKDVEKNCCVLCKKKLTKKKSPKKGE